MAKPVQKPLFPKSRQSKAPIFLYSCSILLAAFLFYWNGFYCGYKTCGDSKEYAMNGRQYAQYFPLFASTFIILISTAWLVTHLYSNIACSAYNCMEMPSAVFSSLLAGISAVIEIHYSIDFNHLDWSEKWSWSAADAVLLCALHAIVAFALQ